MESTDDAPATEREFGAVVPFLPTGSLDAIATEMGTDKRSAKHDYMRFYEALLSGYRDQKFTMLELGVGIPSRRAPSLRTWKEFFPNADIVGMDIREVSKEFEESRVHVEIGDASSPKALRRIFRRWKPSIVLDDASHFWSHQILGFKTLFPMLPPGGIYICEDVHTSFSGEPGQSKYADCDESFWQLVARLQTAIASGKSHPHISDRHEQRMVAWIDAILVSRKTVAILKRQKSRKRDLPKAKS
ncbi:SAM-dependent methyltransferase [Ruegeria arenilitoris]|uniref:SAM-dependent methyltransferase n=1 Tax=Ruegeria arenilitoris TaxID=1173585 RepID=UPI00147AC71F|nr:SAM-dependent methyltransferase [Ruegeria arenilitoris]